MKKVGPAPEEEIRPEYRREDLAKGVRGKYYEAYTKGIEEDLPKRPQGRKLSAARHRHDPDPEYLDRREYEDSDPLSDGEVRD